MIHTMLTPVGISVREGDREIMFLDKRDGWPSQLLVDELIHRLQLSHDAGYTEGYQAGIDKKGV